MKGAGGSVSTASFTPAASAHGALSVYGGAQEFKSVGSGPNQKGIIRTISLRVDNATIETTTWQLALYNVTPPSALTDTTAWDLPSGDRASFIGILPIAQVVDLGSTLFVESNNVGRMFSLLGSSSMFGYLMAVSAITPNNSAHVVTLGVEYV